MATNDFLPFSPTDTGVNLLSQAAYAADAQRTNGNQPGTARSQLINKAMRQSSTIANVVAQYIADLTSANSVDDGTQATLLANLKAAIILSATTVGTPVGQVAAFAGSAAPVGWLKANGAAVSRSVYAPLFAALCSSAIVTITIAGPAVVTWAAHGRSANDPITFTTTGALPTHLDTFSTYYVVGSSITTNTFQLSIAPGGAAITSSGTQSGVHTGIFSPFGYGDGLSTFNVPDMRGEFLRGWDDSRGIDTARAFGSLQLDQFQGHFHSVVNAYGNQFYQPSGGYGSAGFTGSPTTDGVNGTPRTGSETRPRNLAHLFCIKY